VKQPQTPFLKRYDILIVMLAIAAYVFFSRFIG